MPSRAKGTYTRRGTRGPTISDVARAAEASVTTVSRVVRGAPDVHPATRERVQQAIKELGYRASPIARALVRGHSQTVALLVSDIANPFYPQLAKAVEREARLKDYVVTICGTEDSPRVTRRQVSRLLDQGIDGFIHASAAGDEAEVLALVGDANRVVFTNRRPLRPECHYVVSDNVLAAEMLTRHLIDIGHHRIGFVTGPAYASNSGERFQGFCRTVEAHPGVTAHVAEGDFSPESGGRAVAAWVAANQLPTAVIAVNDAVAVGVLEELYRRGLRVPADVAVAGFDDALLISSGIVGLTTVSQQIDEMGRRAVRLLMRLLDHDPSGTPVHDVMEPQLLVRRTTGGAIPPSGPSIRAGRPT